jgi:serine/threonine protein kinase
MPRRRGKQDPFEGFRDVEPIGQGAFAQVYRATDEYTGQPVALKILNVEASKRLDTAAFDLEARALGTVNDHPNIVTLYRAVARPHHAPMLVMELCQGSLADELYRNGPLPVQQVVAIGVKLCGALETAHRAGILHRDLKPQNLLITRYGEPALADFGVAALRDAAAGSSSPLSGLTLLHAAPEVILGHQASPASDVYGLVSTLYELLGGHAPHFITADEDPAVVQRRVLNDPPPALQAPDVTRRLADLVTQALGKTPDGRPSSAKDLAQQLRLVERECGWSLTSCRIAGEGDLPIPDAPPPPPPAPGPT